MRSAAALEPGATETLERFGRIDLLFANSGGPPAGKFADLDDAAWQSGVRAAPPLGDPDGAPRDPIDQGRGRRRDPVLHVVVGEGADRQPDALDGAAGRRLRAREDARRRSSPTDRIRVNQIIPGRIDTDRVRELDGINAKKAGISVEETRKRATAAIPLGRYGDPADYGRAAAFLLSDAASYITGATLQVDGGAIRSVV